MLTDPRIKDLAEVLLKSTKMRKGDLVMVVAIGAEAIPFLDQVSQLALQKGARGVLRRVLIPEVEARSLRVANADQIKNSVGPFELDEMKEVDVFIAVRSPENDFAESDALPGNITAKKLADRPVLEERVNNTRWVVTRAPSQSAAQNAGVSLTEFENFFFRACLFDYRQLKKNHRALMRLMKKTDRVRIVAPGTDLSFSIKGMENISCHGEKNIPDGEVYTAPVRESVNGYITYNAPSPQAGLVFPRVYFEFENGKIVKAEVPGNPRLTAKLNHILDTDEGARYVGEFAIGTNAEITQPAVNILFDEKIIGSFHFTPGMAYEDADNGNRSAVHWDLVQMLTEEYGGGLMMFDGVPIMYNGVFVHPVLLPLNRLDAQIPALCKKLAAAKGAMQIKKEAAKVVAKVLPTFAV